MWAGVWLLARGEPGRHPVLSQSLDDSRNVAPRVLSEGWSSETVSRGAEDRALLQHSLVDSVIQDQLASGAIP